MDGSQECGNYHILSILSVIEGLWYASTMVMGIRKLTAGNRAKTTAVLFLILSISLLGIVVFVILKIPGTNPFPSPNPDPATPSVEEKVEAFVDQDDFKAYLDSIPKLGSEYRTSVSTSMMAGDGDMGMAEMPEIGGNLMLESSQKEGRSSGSRVSTTNVQVAGIDEPDIVKTDGANLFISELMPYYGFERGINPPLPIEDIDADDPRAMAVFEEQLIGRALPPTRLEPRIDVVKAFPANALRKLGRINSDGELLLVNNTLIVLEDDEITAYNVSNPALPVEDWSMKYENNHSLHSARLYGDTLYLVMQASINRPQPCPYVPLRSGDVETTVRCADIYHPVTPVPVDVTYTITSVDTNTGRVSDTVSFVGASNSSVVSMSPSAIYITYTYEMDPYNMIMPFFHEEGSGLIPTDVLSDIKAVDTYNIGMEAKMVEIETIMKEHDETLTKDERKRFENEAENRMRTYISRHKRDYETTGIVKVDRRRLSVNAVSSVPGRPLNQFAIDEHDGNVRIATTTGETLFSGNQDSVSDVYVLDGKLNMLGAVTDLGKGERIYAVRFLGDSAYVVTFRQIDPFYVLDLSSPRRPKLQGELKIPGYSSYLHPLTDELILGVGKEGSQVKVSLFDVSRPTNPREADKFILDEYSSDILDTHHAFLHDSKHKAFFIPATRGGYVFSYTGSRLALETAIDMNEAKRAVFIDDYLYIVGRDEIVVLDERTWQEVGSLRL